MAHDVTGLSKIFPDLDLDSAHFAATEEDFTAYWDIIEVLVLRRKAQGLSQTQIASAMGTTQSAVSEIESLGSKPRIDTIQRYARAVGFKIIFEIVRVDNEAHLDTGRDR